MRGVDILDGTPLLDIKPYSARFDRVETSSNGWQDEVDEETAQYLGRREYKGVEGSASAEPPDSARNRRK